MTDLTAIAVLAKEVEKYNPANIEIDISVFNGVVNLCVNEWHTVSYKKVFSSHIMCDSHEEACLIADVLNTYINKQPYR